MDAQTRYTKSGDVHIAYQASGEGPDLVLVPGWFSNVEAMWDIPPLASFLRRLCAFSRLIAIDKRGVGLSDPIPPGTVPSLEERMDDVRAAMDAVGSERAYLLGISEGGPMNILFAATYPQRTAGLVLLGTYARLYRTAGYDIGFEPGTIEKAQPDIEARWGEGAAFGGLAPSVAGDTELRARWGRYQRLSASPASGAAMLALATSIDVRPVLATIRVPTLVVHKSQDRFVLPAMGKYLADHIPGARHVEIPGEDHLFFIDSDRVVDEIEHFVTGRVATSTEERVLATVLFTDIVDSTAKAAALGDRRWRELLDRHDAFVRRQLERFRGRAVNTSGDGFLATFDGPARAVRCASAITEGTRQLGLEVRAGVHTGECELRGADIAGIAVHTGARVADLAGPGEVLVSQTVKDLVAGSGLVFAERGVHALKGVPGEWRLYAAS